MEAHKCVQTHPGCVYLDVVTVQCCRCGVISPIKIKIVTPIKSKHNTICYLLLLPMKIMRAPIFCDHRRVLGDTRGTERDQWPGLSG